ncbi:hypothetical protein EVAR_42627_1 [Eumeta japonica]|uniref:Uncharacterized protein n=1 Tax=Eumeta variegata TaxID=151549 RepID=A0A4C1WVT7_EUMVA|nr:hypothetical protein EVAR_42627_1 [Eumeta japonica]
MDGSRAYVEEKEGSGAEELLFTLVLYALTYLLGDKSNHTNYFGAKVSALALQVTLEPGGRNQINFIQDRRKSGSRPFNNKDEIVATYSGNYLINIMVEKYFGLLLKIHLKRDDGRGSEPETLNREENDGFGAL